MHFFEFWMDLPTQKRVVWVGNPMVFEKLAPFVEEKNVAWDVVPPSDRNSPRQRKARRVRGPRL